MSYHSVQNYIEILEHCFAVRTIYAYDFESDSYRFKKDKKFYFTDPIAYWASLDLFQTPPPESFESALAETIACEHLSRSYKRLGYFSNRNGEVDFVSGRDLAVEVKWAPLPHNLSKAYKDLVNPGKKVWFQGNFFM